MQFKTLIAAIDVEDDLAEGVIRTADSLAQKDGANLTIVSVWPPLSAAAPGFASEVSVGSTVVSEALMEQHREGRKECEASLKALVQKLAPKAKAVVVDGDPADAVAHYAKENKADLIVTGSHQRNVWGALFKGSPSRDLVREAPCAVFLVTKAFAETLAG